MASRIGDSKHHQSLQSILETGSFEEAKKAIEKIPEGSEIEWITRASYYGNEYNYEVRSPLSVVITRVDNDSRWIDIFKLLLLKGAKPHHADCEEYYWPTSQFHLAHDIADLKCNNADTKNNLMQCLLANSRYPVSLNMRKGMSGEAVLYKLCCGFTEELRQQNLPIIKTILEPRYQVNVNDTGERNQLCCPLYWAAHTGFVGAIHLLLERNAELEFTEWQRGDTPALDAARQNQYDALRVLLNHGAKSFSAKSSLLCIAVEDQPWCRPNFPLFKIAMEFKTDVNMHSPLSSCYNPDMVVMLLKAGADAKAINLRDKSWHMPSSSDLEKIIGALDQETLKNLLEEQDENGDPVLHFAIKYLINAQAINIENFKVLLKAYRKAGVSVDLKNRPGRPPYSNINYPALPTVYVAAMHNFEALKILLYDDNVNIFEEIPEPSDSSSSISELKTESKQEPKRYMNLLQFCTKYGHHQHRKEACELIARELQNVDRRNRIRHAFLSGLNPIKGRDSAIYRCSQNRKLFDRNLLKKVLDDFVFFKVGKDVPPNLLTNHEDFPIEPIACQILHSLTVQSDKIDYVQLTPPSYSDSISSSEFQQQFIPKAYTEKRYLLGDLPMGKYHIPFVIDFMKRRIFCVDPHLNQNEGQDMANAVLHRAIGKFARLDGFTLVTPPDSKEVTSLSMTNNNETINKVLSVMLLVGMVLKAEAMQPSDPLYQSIMVDVESGAGCDKTQHLSSYQKIIAKVLEEQQRQAGQRWRNL